MGKPFADELARLPETIDWMRELDISTVVQFINQAEGSTLVTIGAGGSATAAEFAKLLFEERGGICVAHTPLSFIQCQSDLRGAHILLFTAAGNNRDVLACFDAMMRREVRSALVICGATGSKIETLVTAHPRAQIFTLQLPSGKDGYLATNSLAGACALLLRAFGHKLPTRKTVQQAIRSRDTDRILFSKTTPPYYFYPAIYADWARPAAVDLESKFSEAGLGAVLLADYRNFAHGRHNWIDKQGVKSTVIAFVTPGSAVLAEKTLRLLPSETRIVKFETNMSGPTGGLELLLRVYAFTATIGTQLGIDPGRPGVPSYGSCLYRLGPVIYKRTPVTIKASNLKIAAISRKLAARGSREISQKTRVSAEFDKYVQRLESVHFGAIVADFDGTVANSGVGRGSLAPRVVELFTKLLSRRIPIYFATGRGDSIHSILEASFPQSLHERIFISYYNGALTLPLSESSQFTTGLSGNTAIDEAFELLRADPLLQKLTELKNKQSQISLKPTDVTSVVALDSLVRDIVAKAGENALRVVQSSHSIDVIPLNRSKLACVEFARNRLSDTQEILTVGDRGAFPGNDFALLTHRFSLSVDTVSTDLDSCWNLLPPGVRNIAGLLHYGSWMRIKRGGFTFVLPKDHADE